LIGSIGFGIDVHFHPFLFEILAAKVTSTGDFIMMGRVEE
jgi:hypothetical protein